jgi:hypothetical protein
MKPTNLLSQKPSCFIAAILIAALLAPSAAIAQPRQPSPDAIRAHVLKIGTGHWVRVGMRNGPQQEGEVTGIGPRLFQIEQRGATTPTDVYYTDVVKIRCASPDGLHSSNGKPSVGLIVYATILGAGLITLLAVCGMQTCRK